MTDPATAASRKGIAVALGQRRRSDDRSRAVECVDQRRKPLRFSARCAERCLACTCIVPMSMKLVGCRGCGNLVGANERACPFCGAAVATPRLGLAAGVVLAGLVLGGCASKADTLISGETEAETDTSDLNPSSPSADPNMDPPNSEATYGVPGTDSDWFGTESDGDTETTGDVHDTDSSAGPASDTDTDTDASPSESDGDTDTDTDGPSSDTDVASSDAG